MKVLRFMLFFAFFCPHLGAQIEAPNYDFSLDTLQVFYPGQTLAQMQETHGEGEVVEEKMGSKKIKFYVAHLRYKFPVFVQVDEDNTSLDFFARLPNYFLHDVFHQSLINRYGPQQKYFLQENNAIYKWQELENMVLTYSGSCTITCFPIFVAGVGKNLPQNHVSLLEKMHGVKAR